MLGQTSVLTLKTGALRLQFFKFPDENSFVKHLPLDIERPYWIKQKLWIQTKTALNKDLQPFKRSVWLSPERAFSLYFYMHRVFLSEKQEPLYIVDDENVVKVVGVDEGSHGLLHLIAESKDEKHGGRLVIDYEELLAFMSLLKTFAVFSLFVAGQKECILFQRWGDEYLVLHPITISISLGKLEKANQFLRAVKEGAEDIKPVILKEFYGFKFIPQEGAFLTAPTENIKLSQEQIEKLMLFFSP